MLLSVPKFFRLPNLIYLIKIEVRLGAEPQRFCLEGVMPHGFARLKAGRQEVFHLTAVGEGQKNHLSHSWIYSVEHMQSNEEQNPKKKYYFSKDHLMCSGYIRTIVTFPSDYASSAFPFSDSRSVICRSCSSINLSPGSELDGQTHTHTK